MYAHRGDANDAVVQACNWRKCSFCGSRIRTPARRRHRAMYTTVFWSAITRMYMLKSRWKRSPTGLGGGLAHHVPITRNLGLLSHANNRHPSPSTMQTVSAARLIRKRFARISIHYDHVSTGAAQQDIASHIQFWRYEIPSCSTAPFCSMRTATVLPACMS